MNRRETESESVFFSRLQDLADRCRRDCAPDCTMFLDEMQCAAADAFLQRQAELAYQFWGGYEQAERNAAVCIRIFWSSIRLGSDVDASPSAIPTCKHWSIGTFWGQHWAVD